MSFWKSMIPLAGMAAGGVAGSYLGSPTIGMAAGGALAGGMMGDERQKKAQQVEDAQRKLETQLTRYQWIPGTTRGDVSRISSAGSSADAVGQGALMGGIQGAYLGSSMGKGSTDVSKNAVQPDSGKGLLGADTQDLNKAFSMPSPVAPSGGGYLGSTAGDMSVPATQAPTASLGGPADGKANFYQAMSDRQRRLGPI